MFFKTFGTSIAMRLSKPASVFRVQLSNSAYSVEVHGKRSGRGRLPKARHVVAVLATARVHGRRVTSAMNTYLLRESFRRSLRTSAGFINPCLTAEPSCPIYTPSL